MYLYKSHLDGLYWSEYELSFEDLYCELCGDYDYLIGEFWSATEVLKYMADNIHIQIDNSADYYGDWDIEYIVEILDVFDDCPTLDEATKIVLENKLYKVE